MSNVKQVEIDLTENRSLAEVGTRTVFLDGGALSALVQKDMSMLHLADELFGLDIKYPAVLGFDGDGSVSLTPLQVLYRTPTKLTVVAVDGM